MRLALVSLSTQEIEELRVERGEVAPFELLSHFGNEINTTLPEDIAEPYVIETTMSTVAPTILVNPVAILIEAAVSDSGVGVNKTPELAKESSKVELES